MLEILEVIELADITNEMLRERAKKAKNCRSREFVCVSDGEELAFISIENISHKSCIFVYEIFVLPEHRHRRLGSALLQHAETFASKIGYSLIQLRARAFDHADRSITTEWLVSWYASKGYVQSSPGSEEMEKSLPSELA